jgi:SsrA-binding protein
MSIEVQYKYMRLFNKKARFEYELTGEGVEAGLSLKGAEAKSFREGRGDLSQSFAKIMGREIYLVNANIPAQGIEKYDSTRTRKLLLHRKEILSLATKMKQKKLQIVPIRLYNKGRLIKLYLELGKPKKQFEKKEATKRKDIQRDIETELKNSG